MKKIVRIFSLLLVMIFAISISVNAQAIKKADKDSEISVYEIEAFNVGAPGIYLIKVWSYSKKPTVAINLAKKNAVHGIIFKGFSGKQGVPGQKALATPEVEQDKKAFFDEFFADKGNYNKYVTGSGAGDIVPEDIIKVGKQYKIGLVVSINVSALRKALEEARVIKGLGSGL